MCFVKVLTEKESIKETQTKTIYRYSLFFTSLMTINFCYSDNHQHNKYELMSHCVFNFHFHDDTQHWTDFCTSIGCCEFSFVDLCLVHLFTCTFCIFVDEYSMVQFYEFFRKIYTHICIYIYIIANIYLLAVCNFILLPIGYFLHSQKALSGIKSYLLISHFSDI